MSKTIYHRRQYHYVLEITLNSKVYVCKHSTNKPIEKDQYTGSGDIVTRYVRMFGFKAKEKLLSGRKVLHEYATEDEAFDKEAEIVDWSFVHRKDTLNRVPGGRYSRKGKKLTNKTRKKLSKSMTGKKKTEKQKANSRAAALKRYEDPEERRKTSESLKGHECKPETRKKISDANRGRVHSSPIHGGRSPNNTSQIANRECCGKFWTAPCLAIHKSQFHSDPDDSHPGNILHQSKYRDYIKSLWSSTARWGRVTIARQLPKVFPELFGDQRLVEKVDVIIREFRREQRS